MQTKTINLSLPGNLLKEIDRKAKEEYRSRSELFREAAIIYIQTRDNWKVLQDALQKRAKEIGVKNDDDVEKLIDSIRK